jgi:hypothetical protein
MDREANLIEPLLERAETYGRTSMELLQLRALNKTADVVSSMASRLLLLAILAISAISFNIALALWLGTLLGNNYFGFLITAAFYALVGGIIFMMHSHIKKQITNSIINVVLNS